MSIYVQVEQFEGPLGLLLHLIRKEEMEIFDININQITKQYLEYIKAMKKLDLEVAGDFIAMASTLIQIKAKMLLPQYNDEGEEVEVEDPRKALVQKLLEYEKYQEASQDLYQRPLVGRDMWVRGSKLNISSDKEEEIITEDNALFSLISSYRTVVRSVKKNVHKVMGELQSISERILELRDRLIAGTKTSFFSLVSKKEDNRNQMLVTFLSLLELTRMGFISVFQSENFDDIHIESKKDIDRDVISRADGFESAQEEMGESDLSSSREIEITDEDEEVEMTEEQLMANKVSDEDLEEKMAHQFSLDKAIEDFDKEEEGVEAATDDEIFEEEKRLASTESEFQELELPIEKGELL